MDSLRTDNLNVRHPITAEVILNVFDKRLLVPSQPLGIVAWVQFNLPTCCRTARWTVGGVKVAYRAASIKGVHESGDGLGDNFSDIRVVILAQQFSALQINMGFSPSESTILIAKKIVGKS